MMKQQQSLFLSFILLAQLITPKATPELIIQDVSKATTGTIEALVTPTNMVELRHAVLATKGHCSIRGGGFSQGGHIWHNQGTVIDMQHLNKVKFFDIRNKIITVEAGATWRQLQQFIQQSGLSVKVMQSYNDFSIGGSVAVNVHGRDIAYGPLVDTIISLTVMLPDGTLVTASRDEHYDLFKMICGGYGACGVITEVTLSLTENIPLECVMRPMPLS